MPDEITTGLGEFLDYYWGEQQGFVYVATLEKGARESFRQYMLPWPVKRAGVVQHILRENAAGRDVYFSPAIYKPGPDGSKPRPTKENVLGTRVLWADFDGTAPENWEEAAKEKGVPQPTQIVQSSVKGHEHAYWALDKFETDIEAIEDRNRSIAYSLGADTSGWDADQLLRPAFTTNYGWKNGGERKPWSNGDSVPVTVVSAIASSVSLSQFSTLGTPEREVLNRLAIGDLPTRDELLALAPWNTELLRRFNMSKEEASASSPEKRSGAIMGLGYLAAESGFSDEQMYAMLDDVDVRWDKYTNRSKAGRDKLLRDIIARARAKVGYVNNEELTFAGLLGSAPVADTSQVVFGFESFLNTELNIEWIIQGLVAKNSHGIITGQPGVGKTQFGIQLAIALALGEKFLIWDYVKASPLKVLFLSLEMGHAPLKEFMAKMAGKYPDDLRTLERNFKVAPLGTGVPLDKPQGQAFVNNLMNEFKPDILFVDSVQRMTSSVLTDELAVKFFNDYLQTLRIQHDCATYLIHHNRKKGNSGESAGELSDMYGNQFLSADTDFVVNLRKADGLIAVDAYKNRLDAEWEPFLVERDQYLQFNLVGGDDDFSGLIASGNGGGGKPDGEGWADLSV